MSLKVSTIAENLPRDRHREYNPISGLFDLTWLLEARKYNNSFGNESNIDPLIFNPGVVDTAVQGAPDPAGGNTAWTITTGIFGAPLLFGFRGEVNGAFKLPPDFTGPTYSYPADAVTQMGNSHAVLRMVVKAGTLTAIRVTPKAAEQFPEATDDFDLITGAKLTNNNPNITMRPFFGPNGISPGWWEVEYKIDHTVPVSTERQLYVYFLKAGSNMIPRTGGDTGLAWTWECEYFVKSSGFPMYPPNFDPAPTDPYSRYVGADFFMIPFQSLILPQSMTTYMKYLDRGDCIRGQDANIGIFRIGDSDNTAGSAGVNVVRTSTGIMASLCNGSITTSTSVNFGNNPGDSVEVRTLLFSNGSIQVGVSVNGAAEVLSALSGVIGLPGAWSEAAISPNSLGYSNVGFKALKKLATIAGIKQMSLFR